MPFRFCRAHGVALGSCLLVLAAVACGNGGGGDPPAKVDPHEYGDGDPLSTVLGPAIGDGGVGGWENPKDKFSDDCHYPSNARVNATGLTVSAIDTFDETGSGAVGNYYIQDTVKDPPAYSGATVFGPGFTPPDLRLFPGDVVDFFGTKEEFAGPSAGLFSYCRTLPELDGTITFRFDSVSPLEPKTIKLEELGSYDTARQWLGMLVRVENISLQDASGSCVGSCTLGDDTPCGAGKCVKGPDGAGRCEGGTFLPSGCRFSAPIAGFPIGTPQSDIPVLANELYDIRNQGPDITNAGKYKSITGIVTYFYSFHLSPRSPADFEL